MKKTLAWFAASWEKRLRSLIPRSSSKDIKRVAQELSRLSFDSERLRARIDHLETIDTSMVAAEQSITDLKAGQKVILQRLGLEEKSPPKPKPGKDGMIVVRGTPHLPECALVKERGKKRRIVVTCDCGSMGDREKRYSVN